MVDDGVHVLRATGSTADDIPVPGTPPTNALVMFSFTCNSGICPTVTQAGDFASSAAVAEASDGTLWLVTIREHLDRVIAYKYDGGEACQCRPPSQPGPDPSTEMLAVQRIAPGSKTPSAIVWSQDRPVQPWSSFAANDATLDVSFFGSSLFVTIASGRTVSYQVIDTSSLH
jgi:hypothetical protein